MRLKGAEKFGTKAEVKNLNSFRFLKQALDHEIARQVAIVEGGGRIVQETRLFNPETGETAGMRSKEHAHDYRYFPEPDLVPLRVSEKWLAEVKSQVPELPAVKRARFLTEYGLREYDANVLTAARATERIFRDSGDRLRRSARRGQLGDGRSDGRAEGGRQGDCRFAGEPRASGRVVEAGRHRRNFRTSWRRRFSRRCSPPARRRR